VTTRPGIFRWQAVGPLLGFGAVVGLLWWAFADRVAQRTAERVGTRVVGARVDIVRLHIDLLGGAIEIRGLTVASPHEALRNLLEADELVADIDLVPLLEKKVVIERLAANGLRFGTPRTTPGFVPRDDQPPPTQQAAAAMESFGRRFDQPALRLAGQALDVGRLDAESLRTVAAARAVAAQLDSSRQAWTAALTALDPRPVVDSTRALVERLKTARPTDLALINQARRQLDAVQGLQGRVAALQRDVTQGLDTLRAGVRALDAARQRDYAFARSLVRLPTLDAGDLALALFGREAVSRFERALYWTRLGREYLPAGLQPRADPGPQRLRHSGTDVRFPRQHGYPAFLLEQGELSFTLGAATERPRSYAGRLTGLTSAPAVYGRPTTFAARAPDLALGAMLDHVGAEPRDTAAATLAGVALPAIAVPGLPLRLAPGQGTIGLAFALEGDRLRGRWTVRTDSALWVRDSGSAPANDVERLLERVLSGIRTLDLTAELSGSLAAPRLAVRSNLDRALSQRLREVFGEEVAAAERRLRAEVDGLVAGPVDAARTQLTAVTDDVGRRVGAASGQVAEVQQLLDDQLRRLTRGIRLP
jgi:uncharacterized protein (TIGR03545 family)